MAVTILDIPAPFTAAYKPVIWRFASSRGPVNTTPGETNLAVFTIAVATQASVDAQPGLSLDDIFVVLAVPAPAVFQLGGLASFTGTTLGRYDGTYRVVKVIGDSIFVIDSTDASGSVGGFAAREYDRLRLRVDVTFTNQVEATTYYIDGGTDGLFTLDIRKQAQRSFDDVFDIAIPGDVLSIIQANGYITNGYRIEVMEAWIDHANGIAVNLENAKDAIGASGPFVVNAVQPYHHIDEWTCAVDLSWNDNLQPYIVSNNTLGDDRARMLTYAPYWDGSDGRGQQVRPDDDHWLAFLTTERGTVRVSVAFFGASGLISNTILPQEYPIGSGLIPCGPRNVSPPAGTLYYTVVLLTASLGQAVTRLYRFDLDQQCHRAPRRLYVLNKLGAIDAFTLTGWERRENATSNEVVTRPTMRASVGPYGSWTRRTWRTFPMHSYLMTSQTLTRAWLRYVADEIMESPDTRTIIYDDPIVRQAFWTHVIMMPQSIPLGFEHGKISCSYSFGADNLTQTR